MEKNEKIQQKQMRTVRAVAGSVFVISFIVLLWGLLSMDDESLPMVPKIGDHNLKQNNQQQQQQQQQQNPYQKIPMQNSFSQPIRHSSKFDDDDEPLLVQRVQMLDKEVRTIKASLPKGSFMETDEKGLAASRRLQDATRLLLKTRYGEFEPYRVRVGLKFQPSNPTTETMGETDSFTIELAPSRLQPHSIFTFLEVARHWPEKKGAFHRRADHVLQVLVRGNTVPHLAFQEYSKEYPHKKGTVGYAGRPSGPAWYVSIKDNSENHGPGSQQHENPYEADSCFGRVVEGFERVVLNRITKMPGTGFLEQSAHVLIESMTILVRRVDDEYEEWHPTGTLTEFE